MLKRFRAFDGEEYWYADDKLRFINGQLWRNLEETDFNLQDLEQFIGKLAANKGQIFENDIICNPLQDPNKVYQVIWSPADCGFRKVPFGCEGPITTIDEAFMEILGTIHSYKEGD